MGIDESDKEQIALVWKGGAFGEKRACNHRHESPKSICDENSDRGEITLQRRGESVKECVRDDGRAAHFRIMCAQAAAVHATPLKPTPVL